MDSAELTDRRRAIRHLLDEQAAPDAGAAYYAFYHADFKTQLSTYRPQTARAIGYVCLSRTGLDLFRPLVTLRLPWGDLAACTELLYHALPVGGEVILRVPALYMPLIRAMFEITAEEEQALLRLNRALFRPILNVLVTTDTGPNSLPRYLIRRDGDIGAVASVNWQTQAFAEIGVYTAAQSRRAGWGRSVAAALCHHLLEARRLPLYVTALTNTASWELAESLGFMDTGYREFLLEAALKPKADPSSAPSAGAG